MAFHGCNSLAAVVFGTLISKLLPSANVIGVVCTCMACSRETSRHTTALLRHWAIDAPRPSHKGRRKLTQVAMTRDLKGSVGTPVRCQCPNAGIIRQRAPCRNRCNEKFFWGPHAAMPYWYGWTEGSSADPGREKQTAALGDAATS